LIKLYFSKMTENHKADNESWGTDNEDCISQAEKTKEKYDSNKPTGPSVHPPSSGGISQHVRVGTPGQVSAL